MSDTPETSPLTRALPPEAAPAVSIIRDLRAAGHAALLNGGCVRDLLLGGVPEDYDVATDAPPERVAQLFRATRHVGAQFGVVLVRRDAHWIEVATFRAEGAYSDGRRPDSVAFTDARSDAQRRDFTINGMFLDPLAGPSGEVIDYVGGRADLAAGQVRAIGQPRARFAEDHLRLLRAVRFAARLSFQIEPQTLAAIQELAPRLRHVAPERIHDELARMLAAPSRAAAFELLADCELLNQLCPGGVWTRAQVEAALALLRELPPSAGFPLAFAAILLDRSLIYIEIVSRELTLSNEERETALWLVANQQQLDLPQRISLSGLKRLMAHPAFGDLRALAEARYRLAKTPQRAEFLAQRLQAIAPESVQPAPFVTGADLLARHIPQGPIYRELLDALYTQQLEETLTSREAAIAALEALLNRAK